jgi:hypothetical protein
MKQNALPQALYFLPHTHCRPFSPLCMGGGMGIRMYQRSSLVKGCQSRSMAVWRMSHMMRSAINLEGAGREG